MRTPNALRPLYLASGVMALVSASAASALGLGDISVDSSLRERIAASIPVLTPTPEQRDTLSVHLAGQEDFKRAGIEWSDYLSTLRFRLLDTPAGTRIVIDSDEIVREPFLNLIVEARWANGRLLREYTVLFDPPNELGLYPAKSASPAPAARTAATAPYDAEPGQPQAPPRRPAADKPPTPVRVLAEHSAPAPVVVAQAQPEAAASGLLYGPVRPHEWPRGIAAKLHPAGAATVEQVELALYRANPQAFAHGRLDGLVPGSMLSIPTAGMIEATPASEAKAIILRMRASLHAPTATPPGRAAAAVSRAHTGAAVPARPTPATGPAAAVAPAPAPIPTARGEQVPAVSAAAPTAHPAPPAPAPEIQAKAGVTTAAPVLAVPQAIPSAAPTKAESDPPVPDIGRREWIVLMWTLSGLSLLMALATLSLLGIGGKARSRASPRLAGGMPAA